MLFAWMPRIGIISETQFSVLLFFPILFFLISVSKNGFLLRLKKIRWFLFFLLIVLISSLYNNIDLVVMLLNIRWLILPFFLMIFMLNSKFTLNQLKSLVKFIYFIALIQIPIAIIKYFILDWDGEWPLGLIGYSYSTLLILMFFSGVMSYFFITKKYKYLLLILGVLIIAISSGKRAVVFLIPLFFIISNILNMSSLKAIFKSVFLFVIISPMIIYVLVRTAPPLNPERKVWGTFDIDYVINYSEVYTSSTRVGEQNKLSNRSTTTSYVFEKLLANPGNFLFGYGGDKFSKTIKGKNKSSNEVAKIEYGINGFTWLAYQFGVISSILWFVFFIKFYFKGKKIFRYTNNTFWKVYGQTIMLSSIGLSFVQFFYAPDYKNPLFISYVYVFLFPTIIINEIYNNDKSKEAFN